MVVVKINDKILLYTFRYFGSYTFGSRIPLARIPQGRPMEQDQPEPSGGMGSSSDGEVDSVCRPEEAMSARATSPREPYNVGRELAGAQRAPSPEGGKVGEPKRNKRAAQPPVNPRAPKGPKGRATRKRKPGPGPAESENYTRWRVNRIAHKT